MDDIRITAVGNLVGDPELRFTEAGLPVANFRVASTRRIFDKNAGEWVDGDTVFLGCAAWRSLGENVAESLVKGQRVVVTGILKVRDYENAAGQRGTAVELEVEEVAASLKYAVGRLTKPLRAVPPAATA